ncbi:hypothetical protein CAPN001_14440 [Capnocytophaga stomatis]|uniref:hypothetical protein n=1 Tax=Capnocytophaga stomatis TaxID=1848904 RepID=UPI001950E6FF|nr:hypothetical protein [Capnocytophaga stomatis]GIJ96875.1 hypothetical protein CAPN001_14440 [Capnocytophaga stomatis]GIM50838.1 hypothetical protein CAPN003_22900 [Capnocytophaga stomatis]
MKILSYLKNIFQKSDKSKYFSNEVSDLHNLPDDISDEENIARFVFSPINVNPKSNKLKPNCFRPPAGLDEISVNRYDYTTASFLKSLALKMQTDKKEFFGLGIVKANKIRGNEFEVVYTPIELNPYHSDIKIGYTAVKNEELPAEISYKLRKVLEETKLFIDRNTIDNEWLGDEIKNL